jgi:hypothetical protein
LELSIEAVGSIATAVATIALVFLLYQTVKQLEVTVEVSRVQTEYRFRPWIGHVGSIKKMNDSINGDRQFEITIKNFGELPASNVTASFVLSKNILKREEVKLQKSSSFELGPMLPNMEKHYWFFIPHDVLKKGDEEEEKIFIGLFFSYPMSGKESGYGLISEYNSSTHDFIHRDMWIDDPKLH